MPDIDIQPPVMGERNYAIDQFQPHTVDGPEETPFDAVRESQVYQASAPNYLTIRSAWSYVGWASSRLNTIESRIEPHWASTITWAGVGRPGSNWCSYGFLENSSSPFQAIPWHGPNLVPNQALGSYAYWTATAGQVVFQILEVKARFKMYYLVLNAVMKNNLVDNLKWSPLTGFVRNPWLVSSGTLLPGQTLRLQLPQAGAFAPGYGLINYIVPNLTWGQYRSLKGLP
jgi:hypothetical protein